MVESTEDPQHGIRLHRPLSARLCSMIAWNDLDEEFKAMTLLVAVSLVFTLLFIVLMALRVGQVSAYQTEMLNKVSSAARQDIEADRPWKWRYEMLDSVSYETMLWQFWRPLNSFYDEEKILGVTHTQC